MGAAVTLKHYVHAQMVCDYLDLHITFIFLFKVSDAHYHESKNFTVRMYPEVGNTFTGMV